MSFPCGSSTGSITERIKSSGHHYCWILQTGAIRIRRGTHSCLFLGALLKSYWCGEMEDLCFNFISLHLSPDCMDLDARLYIEVADDIDRKQINILQENLLVENYLKTLGWRSHSGFFLDSLCVTVFSIEGRYSAVIDILRFRRWVRSLCLIWSYVLSSTKLSCCLSEKAWVSLFSLCWRKMSQFYH